MESFCPYGKFLEGNKRIVQMNWPLAKVLLNKKQDKQTINNAFPPH